jgi:hypothetical protein
VLVIRVWFEPDGAAGGFRARITVTPDVLTGQAESQIVPSPAAVISAVETWLRSLPGPSARARSRTVTPW